VNPETLIESLKSIETVDSTDGVRQGFSTLLAVYKNLCVKAADEIESLMKERDEMKQLLSECRATMIITNPKLSSLWDRINYFLERGENGNANS